MPIYHRLGQVPAKRHSTFRKPDGSLYPEQVMGNKGFSGLASIIYHRELPTTVKEVRELGNATPQAEAEGPLRLRHFRSGGVAVGGSATLDRVPLMFNQDVTLSVARPTRTDDFTYRNGQADEVIFVSDGEGVLESLMGELPYRKGDYLVIPRSVPHRLRLGEGDHRLLIIESAGYVRTPKRYRNEHGQLLEHSPFCERDMRRPETLGDYSEQGEHLMVVKQAGRLTEVSLEFHPLNVVGWDGYYYPWALNVEDFEPIVGSIHQPPPVHQTFEGDGFVVCSFVPRPFDFHPEAVPAPYHHSNVMTDEVLYYATDEFMSRKGIEYGSLTLHPDGLTHGPHPGKAEDSVGKERTDELAVMVDTFRPLQVASTALAVEDPGYFLTWRTGGGEG